MQINSYLNYNQPQMRILDNSNSADKKDLLDIMKNLTLDQRLEFREKISSLNIDDRKSVIEQINQIDKMTMSQDEYYKMIIDIINRQVPPTATIQSLFYIYA